MDIKKIIGDRIKSSRENMSLSQEELGQLTGFSNSRISNWERGTRTPKFSYAEKLAKALEVNVGWLLCMESAITDESSTPNRNHFESIPVYSMKDKDPFESMKVVEYFPLSDSLKIKVSHKSFAVKLVDDSMSPKFNENDIIVFQSELDSQHDQIVLVQLKGSKELVLRKISQNKGQILLTPINVQWPTINMNSKDQFTIVGTVNEAFKIVI
jgi:SOS-response transcriptional repressor LexA